MRLTIEIEMRNIQASQQERIKFAKVKASIAPQEICFKDGEETAGKINESARLLVHAGELTRSIRELSEEYLKAAGFKFPEYLEELSRRRYQKYGGWSGHPSPVNRNEMRSNAPCTSTSSDNPS